MQHILLADSDRSSLNMTKFVLEAGGYRVTDTARVRDLALLVEQESPDLVLFDTSRSPVNRFDLCRDIRRTSDVPLIFLAECAPVEDRVRGLQMGGDDYIVKPYAPTELLARVAAVLRRCVCDPHHGLAQISRGPLTLDPTHYTVTATNCRAIPLTPTEFRLLHYLMQNTNQIVTTDQIVLQVWSYDSDARNLVAVYMRRLRIKIEHNPQSPQYLMTIPNTGYTFVTQHESQSTTPALARAVGASVIYR